MKCLIRTVSMFGLFILVFLPLVSIAAGPGVHSDKLVGHWTFEKGEELKDLTGNWPDIKLMGAKIAKGALDVDAAKWALTVGDYKGPDIREKTLMSWFSFQNNGVIKGSIVCIDKISEDSFDSIVYAERQANQWMAGSSWFKRTDDFKPGFKDTSKGEKFMMAVTYSGKKSPTVKGYRNGKDISGGGYEKGEMITWEKDDAEVIWGKRHGGVGGGPGDIDGLIYETRIYGVALTEKEIAGMEEGSLSVESHDKLSTKWAVIKGY